VEICDYTGLVLVNTAIPTGVDFKTSTRIAVIVTQRDTGFDLSKKDVIFSISSENQQEIQTDGTIGKIGGIAQKAEAADKNGAKIFLVLTGQAVIRVQSCVERRKVYSSLDHINSKKNHFQN